MIVQYKFSKFLQGFLIILSLAKTRTKKMVTNRRKIVIIQKLICKESVEDSGSQRE